MLLSQRVEFDNPSSTSQATMTAPKRIPSDKTFDVMVLQFVAGGKYGVIAKVIGRPRPARKAYSAPYPRGSAPSYPRSCPAGVVPCRSISDPQLLGDAFDRYALRV